MARTLKYTIQVFWAIFGSYSLVGVIEIMGYRLFGHPTHSLGIFTFFFLLLMSALLSIIIFTAYVALFRFSSEVIAPTVLLVSIVMFSTAMHGFNHNIQPMVERGVTTSPLSIMPFLVLLTLFVIIFGAFRFYRFTLAAIQKTLFPDAPLPKALLS